MCIASDIRIQHTVSSTSKDLSLSLSLYSQLMPGHSLVYLFSLGGTFLQWFVFLHSLCGSTGKL